MQEESGGCHWTTEPGFFPRWSDKYEARFEAVLTAGQYTKCATMPADRMNRDGAPGMVGVEANKMKVKSVDGDKINIKVVKD